MSGAQRECRRLENDRIQNQQVVQESEKKQEALIIRMEAAEEALRKEQRLRKEAEAIAAERQVQMQERTRAAEELIEKLIKEHNETFERMQNSYTNQIDRLQQDYKNDYKTLKNTSEQAASKNTALTKLVNDKSSEIVALQKLVERGQKWKSAAFTMGIILGSIAFILIIILCVWLSGFYR